MNQAGAQCAKKGLRSRFGGETIDQAAGAGSQPRWSKIYCIAGTLVQHEVVVVAIRIS
jgi:hypothetical protein